MVSMNQVEIRKKVEAVIEKYSALGAICDVWLSPGAMTTLDPRPPIARIMDDPYKIGDVFVSAFSSLSDNEFRIAFVTDFGVLDEPSSDN